MKTQCVGKPKRGQQAAPRRTELDMRHSTRRWSTGVIAIAATLGLAACGSAGPTQEGGGDGNAASASMWGLTSPSDIIPGSVEAWNQANPDNRIELDEFASDPYKTKVRTAIGAGEGPTIIFGWGGGILESYVDAGEVLDLTPYIEANPELRERYLPAVLENGVIDGKTYALPNNNAGPVMLYYNKELFEQVGAEPPQTWNELMELVEVFNSEEVAPIALAGQSRWPMLMWLEYLVERIGGPEVFQAIAANEPDAWSHPAVIESLEKIQELVSAGGFVEGFSSISANAKADLALLYTGRAAMMLHLGSVYADMKTIAGDFVAADNLGYVPFPAVEGGEGAPENVVGNPSNFWSVSAHASEEQIDTAIGYMTDEMFSEDYVNQLISSGAVPVVKGIEEKIAQSEDSDFLSTVYNMTVEAPSFQLSWDQALAPAQADAMLTNLSLIFLLDQTPQEFVDIMNGTIE